MQQTAFANIIIPLPVPRTFTYRVPNNWQELIQVGMRAVVPLGTKKVLTGIIQEIHATPPQNYQAKYILDILDSRPYVTPTMLKFWQWLANYYLCTLGDIMQAALPSGLKISSDSRIQLNPELEEDFLEKGEWTEEEMMLLDALKAQPTMTYPEASEVLESDDLYFTIKYLVAKKAILLYEQVKEKYQPKKEKRVRLAPHLAVSEQALEGLFNQLSKKPKQEAVLLKYLSQVPIYSNASINDQGLVKSSFLSPEGGEISASSFNTLKKNGIFEEFEVIVSRMDAYEDANNLTQVPDLSLSQDQQEAFELILSHFESKNSVLLHGITGSGKTEIYIELIQQVMDNGSQVLLMLPEIALTTQIVVRLKKAFGSRIGIYHSKFSDNERVEVWKGVAEGRYPFVVGVRSSIFLPFDNLGLIIVDEEHEGSYKQYDPAPRYHARDSAQVLAQLHGAKVLLGSATPSVESYYMAQQGKYGLVSLLKRYGKATLPELRLIDTALERKQNKMQGSFSSELIEALQHGLMKEEQSILFQNRRGYAPYMTCDDCSWTPECRYCSVSLTYHLYKNELRCHYCGYKEAAPKLCVTCGSTKLNTKGLGTEQIEEELQVLAPQARIQRMDKDTTRKKLSYQQIISDFEQGNTDVLVGTQMVSKGLDFDKVSLVGVFEVDRLMHFPDFRAHERTFQLITQVSGRAGRRNKKGLVLIQTGNPQQKLLQLIAAGDYESMYANEIREREQYAYPPFTRLIRLTIRAKEIGLRNRAAEKLAFDLRQQIGDFRVLGPEPPSIDKIRNYFLTNILIKIERKNISLGQVKGRIKACIQDLCTTKGFKQVEVVADVDCL